MKILIIEDDRKIGGFLERGLREEGHAVTLVTSMSSARGCFEEASWDLAIVDRMLPDGDGLSLVRELRQVAPSILILCLSARNDVRDRVEGLYSGADDYLTKPFDFDELLARITALSRRRGGDERLEIDDLTMDLVAHRVFRGGDEITLTPREFALLRCLVENRGRVLTRTRLLERVWDTTHDPGNNVVDVYISYLRRKVEHDGGRKLIHTVRGVGYVLDVDR